MCRCGQAAPKPKKATPVLAEVTNLQSTVSASATSGATIDGRPIEEVYQKKSQLEHILLRPDTYIGSVEEIAQPLWVFENDKVRWFTSLNERRARARWRAHTPRSSTLVPASLY